MFGIIWKFKRSIVNSCIFTCNNLKSVLRLLIITFLYTVMQEFQYNSERTNKFVGNSIVAELFVSGCSQEEYAQSNWTSIVNSRRRGYFLKFVTWITSSFCACFLIYIVRCMKLLQSQINSAVVFTDFVTSINRTHKRSISKNL